MSEKRHCDVCDAVMPEATRTPKHGAMLLPLDRSEGEALATFHRSAINDDFTKYSFSLCDACLAPLAGEASDTAEQRIRKTIAMWVMGRSRDGYQGGSNKTLSDQVNRQEKKPC